MAFVISSRLRLLPPKQSEINAVYAKIKQGLRGNINVGITVPKEAVKNIRDIEAGLKRLERTSRRNNTHLGKSVSLMQDFADKTKLAFKRYSAFVVGTNVFLRLADALGKSVGKSFELQRELSKIAQVTDSSIASTRELKEQVIELAQSYGVSSLELATAARTLRQAGIDAQKTKAALDILAKTNLAPTFNDIGQTTDDLIAIYRQFNLEAYQLKGAFDAINYVASQYAVDAGDIGEAVKKSGSAFVAAGGSLEEYIATVTIVRDRTRESANVVGTSIKTITSRLQNANIQKLLRSEGIQLINNEGNFIGPLQAFKAISKELATVNQQSTRFSKIVNAVGGLRQVSRIIPLLTNPQDFDKIEKLIKESAGSLEKDMEEALQTVTVAILKTKEAFDVFIDSITSNKVLNTLIRNVFDLTTNLLKLGSAISNIPVLGESLISGLSIFAGAKILSKGAQFGKLLFRNSGGLVSGRGPNKDSIPAMLTKGEYVMNRKAVDTYGPSFFAALNGYNKGGIVGLNTGGDPTKNYAQSGYTNDDYSVVAPSLYGDLHIARVELNRIAKLHLDTVRITEQAAINSKKAAIAAGEAAIAQLDAQKTQALKDPRFAGPALYPESEKRARQSERFFLGHQLQRNAERSAKKGLGEINPPVPGLGNIGGLRDLPEPTPRIGVVRKNGKKFIPSDSPPVSADTSFSLAGNGPFTKVNFGDRDIRGQKGNLLNLGVRGLNGFLLDTNGYTPIGEGPSTPIDPYVVSRGRDAVEAKRYYRRAGLFRGGANSRRARAAASRISSNVFDLQSYGHLARYGGAAVGNKIAPAGGLIRRGLRVANNVGGAIGGAAVGIPGLVAFGAYSHYSDKKAQSLQNISDVNKGFTSTDIENGLTANRKGLAIGGGVIGGVAGASLGAKFGGVFGPIGAGVGAAVGALGAMASDITPVRDALKKLTFGLVDYKTSVEETNDALNARSTELDERLKQVKLLRDINQKLAAVQNKSVEYYVKIQDLSAKFAEATAVSIQAFDKVGAYTSGNVTANRNADLLSRAATGNIQVSELSKIAGLAGSPEDLRFGRTSNTSTLGQGAATEAIFIKALPTVLSKLTKNGGLGEIGLAEEFFRNGLDEQFKNLTGVVPGGDQYDVIKNKFAGEFVNFIDRGQQTGESVFNESDIEEGIKRLKDSSTDFIKAFELMHKTMENFNDGLISLYDQRRDVENQYIQSTNDIARFQVGTATKLKDFRGDKSSNIGLYRSENFAARANSASGIGFTPNSFSDIRRAGADIRLNQARLQNEQYKANTGQVRDAVTISGFKDAVNSGTRALKALADSSTYLSQIEEEIGRERAKREQVGALAERTAFGTREDKRELDKNARNAARAAKYGLSSVRREDRGGVLDYINSLSEVQSADFGTDAAGNVLTGQQLKDKLIKKETGFNNTPQGREKNLIKEYERIANLSAAAQKELADVSNTQVQISQAISEAINNFNTVMSQTNWTQLADSMKNFPGHITGQFKHDVNVTFNGTAAFKDVEASMEKLAVGTFKREFNRYITENLPEHPTV